MVTQNNRLFIILFSTGLLLLIPLIAMQFTDQVNWSLSDFAVMGVLLISTGLICEFVLRKVNKTSPSNCSLSNHFNNPLPYLGRACSRYLWDTFRRKLNCVTYQSINAL